jgi:hypothetical protein
MYSLLKSMELHTMLEGYFTDDQKQRIVAHCESLGPEKDLGLRIEWLEPQRMPAIVAYVQEARAIRTGQGAG